MVRPRRLAFDVVSEEADLAALRALWRDYAERTRTSPFGSPAFFDAWRSAFAHDRSAFVVVGRRDRQVEIMLPMWQLAGRPSRWDSLGAYRADYTEPVVGSADRQIAGDLWDWLEEAAPCATAKLARVPVDSPLGRTVPRSSFDRAGRTRRAVTNVLRTRTLSYLSSAVHEEHPFADAALIAELSSRLHAKNVHRKYNLLKRMGGDVTYDVVRGAAQITPYLERFFAMHISNFSATGRESQFESERDCAFYERLVQQPDFAETIVLDVLRVTDRPVAMHLGFQHGGVIYYYKPAFDLEFGKASPGRILLSYMFARAAEQGMQRFELLKGNEAYKSEWTNRCMPTLTSTLTRRTLRQAASGVASWMMRDR